jgi:hypothetical protein
LAEMAALVAKLLWDVGFRRIVAGSVAKSLLTKCVEQLGVFITQPVRNPESQQQGTSPKLYSCSIYNNHVYKFLTYLLLYRQRWPSLLKLLQWRWQRRLPLRQ